MGSDFKSDQPEPGKSAFAQPLPTTPDGTGSDSTGLSTSLTDRDVGHVVRLLGEVAAKGGSLMTRRQCLMQKLARLVQADHWMWNISPASQVDGALGLSLMHNLTDTQLALLTQPTKDATPHPSEAALRDTWSQCNGHWTERCNADLPKAFARLPVARLIHQVHRDGGDCMLSVCPVPQQDDLVSAVAMYRLSDANGFTSRDSSILHTVTCHVPWLHGLHASVQDTADLGRLTPRQQTVLTMLVEGHSIKRIAFLLKLSEHTIRDHVKSIYRAFEVNSRAQLMHRFMMGEAGDSNQAPASR